MSLQLIQNIELSASSNSITFTNIPQTYTDLKVFVTARIDSTDELLIQPNSSSSNLSYRLIRGYNGGLSSATVLRFYAPYSIYPTGIFGNGHIYIPNYTSSNPKGMSAESSAPNNSAAMPIGMVDIIWNDTSPITSLKIAANGGNSILAGSIFTIYGISNGSDGVTTVS